MTGPKLLTVRHDGRTVDVVAQATKSGFLFVFDRVTGAPIWPIDERPVPVSDVSGEELSPTQPYPADLPLLAPSKLSPDDAWGLTPWDRGKCRDRIAAARNEGLYTPMSEQGGGRDHNPNGFTMWMAGGGVRGGQTIGSCS